MTAPATKARGSEEKQAGAAVRRGGRNFMIAFYAALRAIKLYPLEHSAVQKALAELAQVAEELRAEEGELEFRISGEFIFLNETRLRLDLSNYATFGHILTLMKLAGIGTIQVGVKGGPRDWSLLLSLLGAETKASPAERFKEIVTRLKEAKIETFQLEAPAETASDKEFNEEAKAAANRTYSQSVAVTKDVINSVRIGKTPNIRKIKRVVQGIVDQVLNEETSLIGLTAIRDYDEYTFTHSVNVCIFSVAIGKRLGLTKLQLYDLGMAALFHDIGKSRVPSEVLNKVEGLTDDEWKQIAAHPWMGVLSLFQLRGTQDLHYRAMIVAYEHHMKVDLTGYPRPVRDRRMSVFSKIVAVADGFDAATSRRSYQTTPMNPADVMKEMRDNSRRGMDPVLVKAFVNLTGIYPVGTLVVLDTFELGLVHASNPIAEMLSRPIVRIVSDDKGNVLFP
ncbi:MAG TPA: HD-GYP domain-containing protein [Gemmatimonadaceae bacterium]|nr:HD-GYP domain-containing protein [Gemmatimonadaceae bacterium]